MKKSVKIIYFLFAFLIFVSLLTKGVWAIEPFKEEPPIDLPSGAEPKEVEVLERAKDIVKKEIKLTVERIHPEAVKIGETVEVTLKITSFSQEKVKLFVTETHKPGLEYPDPIEVKAFHYQSLEVPYYGWEKSLEAGKEMEIKYNLKPKTLGMILFSPAIVNDEYGNTFESAPTTLKITCHSNKKCDPGENYIFCPEDCRTGSKDGVCDGADDGRCDPDCQPLADQDCQKARKAPKHFHIIIGIVSVIILLAVILVLRFLKKKIEKRFSVR